MTEEMVERAQAYMVYVNSETLTELSRRPTQEQYEALERERARLQGLVDFFQEELVKRMKTR